MQTSNLSTKFKLIQKTTKTQLENKEAYANPNQCHLHHPQQTRTDREQPSVHQRWVDPILQAECQVKEVTPQNTCPTLHVYYW